MLTNYSNNWAQLIQEELGVKDQDKLRWMSKYAQIHEAFLSRGGINEALQNVSIDGSVNATPLNTLGAGNPMMPVGVGFNGSGNGTGIGNTGADFHNYKYGVGSGDIPVNTLGISLEVAAATIGLELVPVIPAAGPWVMLQYVDTPYAGGKLGRMNETTLDGKGAGANNKPIYIKVSSTLSELKAAHEALTEAGISAGSHITIGVDGGNAVHGIYLGKSRIDNSIIIKVISTGTLSGTTYTESETISIADAFSVETVSIYDENLSAVTSTSTGSDSDSSSSEVTLSAARADVVASRADHIQSFSNFFGDGEGNDSDDPMTRAQNETGVGNRIGFRTFTKMIQMGSYEVTGSVTRQQLQDMPLYGIDVVATVIEGMQNELSQAINNRILDRLFKLGTTNAYNQKMIQGVELNLYFAGAGEDESVTKDLADFTAAKYFVGIDGTNLAEGWGEVVNATKNTAAENVHTHQRRIMSRVLAAANLIANVSRWGRANWVVTNVQVLSALQDAANFVVAPMVNTLEQNQQGSIYFAGSIAGLNIYIDPNMKWDDTRVLVGRKSDGKKPGVVFMPYILADKVQITAEATFAPSILMNSRFAIVDLGFHPEQNYFCFMVDAEEGYIL